MCAHNVLLRVTHVHLQADALYPAGVGTPPYSTANVDGWGRC